MSALENIIAEIVKAIRLHSDPEKIILFGSRAQGYETERSDIDIAVQDALVTDRQMRLIREAVEDIRTLRKIDIVWLERISEDFRQEIFRTGKVIYERERKAAVCSQ